MEATVLRLFRFVPVHIGFDAVLRDTFVPDLLGKPGMVDVFVGRAGPDETGHRLVATFWADVDAMTAAVGRDLDSSPFHPEHLSSTTDHDLRWLPLTFAFPVTDPTEVTILRLVRGRVRPGELDAYIEEARQGTAADMAGRDGPCGLYLATEAEDAFVTLSMWPSWDGLLAATGGDYRRPVATRHAERLVSWDAEHFEALPGLPVAPTRADAPV